MNISYNWLKEYIQHDLTAEELAQALTGIGLEVEAIEPLGKKDDLDGFVIGKVTTCQKHPDSDHLFITTVDVGMKTDLNIVCGAPNVAAGQHVVVATPGSKVRQGDQHFVIKKAKIRGVVSEGMICAEDEIGLGEGHDGILVLPDQTIIGEEAGSYFYPDTDFRLTIGLTPNRIDSASHIGVARDLAAYLGQHKPVRMSKPDLSSFHEGTGSDPVSVIIENEQACRRYAGLCMKDVTIAESPGWLQNRLRSVGLNPINNVVDITNFVMYEMGQPLHAFDADALRDRKIIVKNLPAGTRFVTLDGIEHVLSEEDLMICDGAGPVAIAGVFGGLESGVTDNTQQIFLESAYFEPVSVRRTSKRLGINTDASYRFERGIDPDTTLDALKRCAVLIEEVTGGKISSSIVDAYPNPIRPRQVELSYANTARLIGKTLSPEVIKPILLSLEIQIVRENEKGLVLLVPPYRVDVEREADVIEEILRIYGYNNIDMSGKLNASLSFSMKPEQEKVVDTVSNLLCSHGFYEIMCNSLTRSAYYDHLTTYTADQLVRLLNPLSHDLNVMRQTLILGGLEAINHNTNRQRPDLRLFEFGKCYRLKKEPVPNDPLSKYHEEWRLSLFVTGRSAASDWSSGTEPGNYFLLKGYLENILAMAGLDIDSLETAPIKDKKDIYESGLRYSSESGTVAEIGVLAPELLKIFDIKKEVFHAEVVWKNLMEAVRKHEIRFRELPRYPEARRDLSLLLDKNVTYKQIKELGFRTEKQILKRIQLFDVFEGKKIEQGKKSYAVAFFLQDSEKTLTDERIERTMKKLMDTYVKELKAVIR